MLLGNLSLPISAVRVLVSAAGVTIPISRLWVELAFARRADLPLRQNCLFDSGAPVCVIPFAIHNAGSFAWQPLPGPWPPGLTTWMGVPCIVGAIDVWVPIPEAPYLSGPLTCIAKLAQAMPGKVPANHPILLGLNFLADYRAENAFQCHTPPQAGSILLP